MSPIGKILVRPQFCGPPNSGNGGYVSGLIAEAVEGPATCVLRAPVPLDTDLVLERSPDGAVVLKAPDGGPIGTGTGSDGADLPEPPQAPSLEAARAAGARFRGLSEPFHPICFTCGPQRAEGEGLRVFTGPLGGAPEGHVAGVWAADPAFADADGLAPLGVIWAALDCPGYYGWVEKAGRHWALLGTMTAEVLRRPACGETCIVLAWPIGEREGRKALSGVALYSAEGELLARGRQVWIAMGPITQEQRASAEAAA